MKQITFVTGNSRKLEEASSVLRQYGVMVEQLQRNSRSAARHSPQKAPRLSGVRDQM